MTEAGLEGQPVVALFAAHSGARSLLRRFLLFRFFIFCTKKAPGKCSVRPFRRSILKVNELWQIVL
jgi:hypothetical protein